LQSGNIVQEQPEGFVMQEAGSMFEKGKFLLRHMDCGKRIHFVLKSDKEIFE